jgi:hypothetical protein
MHTNWGDAVAVYAAVVATGALGWQVYQWRYDRLGRLALWVRSGWRDEHDPYVEGTISNSNDFPVRLLALHFHVNPLHGSTARYQVSLTPERAGLPREVPAHDSVAFHVDGKNQMIGSMGPEWISLRSGTSVRVTVVTSLHRRFTAGLMLAEYEPPFVDESW